MGLLSLHSPEDAAKAGARMLIPPAASAGYEVVKLLYQGKINSDKEIIDKMLKDTRDATSSNLQGNAGNKALEAIDTVKSDTDFAKGVSSIR